MTWQNPVALLAASLYPAQTQIVFRHITPPKKERRSQGGAGASSPSLSVRVPPQSMIAGTLRKVTDFFLEMGKFTAEDDTGNLCWAERRTSSRRRVSWNYRGVRKHGFKTIHRNGIHLLTNLEAEELAPPL